MMRFALVLHFLLGNVLLAILKRLIFTIIILQIIHIIYLCIIIKTADRSLIEFISRFPTNDSCESHYANLRLERGINIKKVKTPNL